MATVPPNGIILEASGLTKHFGGVPALHDVGFVARKGQVDGPDRPQRRGEDDLHQLPDRPAQAGRRIHGFDGRELFGLSRHRIARLGIARTFQNLAALPRLSVLDNVLCGFRGSRRLVLEAFLRTPSLRHRERRLRLAALEALDTFGLADRAEWRPERSPTGRRSVWSWRAPLSSGPRLLLLDEPVAGPQPRRDGAGGHAHPADSAHAAPR